MYGRESSMLTVGDAI